jgi:hypothetical protein
LTRVAIHQPEYFPWPGFLAKAKRADVFVLLDNVQFDRASLQHRCKVVGANGVHWLTIPFVHRFPQTIDEVAFSDDRWRVRHWKSLQADYGRVPGWKTCAPVMEAYFARTFERMVDATAASVELLLGAFGVTTRVVRASSLAARGEKGELVLAICRELGATTYLSGRTGAAYLDHERFAAGGVAIEVQRYTPGALTRQRPIADAELRGVSALDAWFYLGDAAPRYLPEEPCAS